RRRTSLTSTMTDVVVPALITIREIHPGEDAPGLEALLSGLDARSRYLRWFSGAVDVHRAARWAAVPERQHALGLVAVADNEIVGHGVLVPLDDDRAEVAFEVAESWRHHGIAGGLLDALAAAGRERGLRLLTAEVLAENADMLAVFREHGARCSRGEGVVDVELAI
ncbi:MAG TPA: GNAT family N-acetyltransferase, partial [Solirubrobacteraceae bacterium]